MEGWRSCGDGGEEAWMTLVQRGKPLSVLSLIQLWQRLNIEGQ